MTERSTIAFPVGREKTCRRANTCRPESNRKNDQPFLEIEL